MLQQLFKKWWVLLLQGILLIILSIYIFNYPEDVLKGISFWFGLIVLAAGLLGVIGWFAADRSEKENMSLLWSILTAAFGLLMLLKLGATMKTITIIFGLWFLVSGIFLLKNGWPLKDGNSLGWIMVIVGVFSVIAAVMMIFDIGAGAIGIATLLGLSVLLTGIAMVLLALAKKALVSKVKSKIGSM